MTSGNYSRQVIFLEYSTCLINFFFCLVLWVYLWALCLCIFLCLFIIKQRCCGTIRENSQLRKAIQLFFAKSFKVEICYRLSIIQSLIIFLTYRLSPSFASNINPFQANVPLMEKPGGWFLLAKCVKNILPQVFFTHFTWKDHPPGFSINGTLAWNGLIESEFINFYFA